MYGRTFAAYFGSGYDFMSLQDQHLQQALKHAPDSELMPSDATRKAVLAYVHNSLTQAHEKWLSRPSNVWHEWVRLKLAYHGYWKRCGYSVGRCCILARAA